MEYRRKIIAVDFDGCLAENAYPDIGAPIRSTINALIDEQTENDTKLILWTCRLGDRLNEAVEWCEEHGLHFEAVNENLPDIIDAFGGDTRKIFANEYWDDKAVRKP